MRLSLTILATIVMAGIAVYIGGSASALAIMLHPELIENLAIPALLAVPVIAVLAFAMGALVFRSYPAASPISVSAGVGTGPMWAAAWQFSATTPFIFTPMACAAFLLASLFVGLPSVVFRWREFAALPRTGFVAATAIVFCAVLGLSVHHSIGPSAVAIERLQPSPKVPSFNPVGMPLEGSPRQQQAHGESGHETTDPASPARTTSPHAEAPPALAVPSGLEREQRFQEAFRRASDAGTLRRSPELDRMRSAVVNAAAAVRSAPCDAAARTALRNAIVTFIRDMPRLVNRDDIEMFSAEGMTRETSIVFNQPALKVTRAALHDRLLAIDELPAMSRPSFAGPQPADTVELATTLHCPG
jgi:hypothetical protein